MRSEARRLNYSDSEQIGFACIKWGRGTLRRKRSGVSRLRSRWHKSEDDGM